MLLDRYFEKLASDRPKARPRGILPQAPPKFAAGLKQMHRRFAQKPLLVFSRREVGSKNAAQPISSMKRMILDDYFDKLRKEKGSIKQHTEKAAQPAPTKPFRMILDDYFDNLLGRKGGPKQHSEQVAKPSLFRRIHMILDDYLDNNFIGGKGEAKRQSESAASPTPFRRIYTILDGYIDNLFEKNAGFGWFIGNRALIPQF